MASTSGGSIEMNYTANKSEREIAIQANKAIGASFSESDVIMTKKGPYVIEVNPTAGYFVDSLDDIERMQMIISAILNKSKSEVNFAESGMVLFNKVIKNIFWY